MRRDEFRICGNCCQGTLCEVVSRRWRNSDIGAGVNEALSMIVKSEDVDLAVRATECLKKAESAVAY
jgi:hypothetical protein